MKSVNTHISVSHIGARLKAKREALDLSIDDVARMTKLRPEYLQNIEVLNVKALPSIGYVLGFVRSYATALGMDGDNAVADYKLDVEAPENLEMRDRPHFVPQFKMRLPRGFVPALMTVGFAVMLGTWYGLQTETQALEQSAPDYSLQDVASEATPITDKNLVTLRATAPSWLQVKDETGTVLVSRIFVSGETWQGAKDNSYSVSARDAGAIEVFYGEAEGGVLGARGEALRSLSRS